MEGTILDPFGDPLSTSMACLQTELGCISMDQESNRFKYAQGWLRIFATPDATIEDHDVYTRTLITSDSSGNTASEAEPMHKEVMSESQDTPSKKKRTANFPQRQERPDAESSADKQAGTNHPSRQESEMINQTSAPSTIVRRSTRRSSAATRRATHEIKIAGPNPSPSDNDDKFSTCNQDWPKPMRTLT